MHVRIAWEIYNHQQKAGGVEGGKGTLLGGTGSVAGKDLLRPPSHTFPPPLGPPPPPHAFPPRTPYDAIAPPSPYLNASHLGK